jgi:soluble lytic murein transglycosylase-like protein
MLQELGYMAALVRSIVMGGSARGSRRVRPAGMLVVSALLLSAAAWTATETVAEAAASSPDHVAVLRERAESMRRHLDRVEAFYEAEAAPLERVLLSQGADEALARRVATALVAEARRNDLEPRLLLGVLLVENPWIDPRARSPVGARGLMQVMPFHEGKWGDCEPRLDNVEANICHGARIFASYLQSENGNIERALLRYNGCVRGTNTPNCHAYPGHVLARTGGVTIHDWRAARAAASVP